MPARRLPSNPSLEHLRNEARDLQRGVRSGEPDAVALVAEHHPDRDVALSGLKLTDAQLVVARRYGFPSWNRLREHLAVVEAHARSPHEMDVEDDDLVARFLNLACLTYGSSDSPSRWAQARALLDEHPSIATANIWAMATAGAADALAESLADEPDLVDREGGPQRWAPLLYAAYSRVPLDGRSTLDAARVLVDHGADPNAGYLWEGLPSPFTALTGALGGGEDAVNQPPHPDGHALARLLLEAGADPNDNQALYNRMFDPSDDHFELLFAHGLGQGDGGPWRARMPAAAESIPAMLAMQLQWAAERGMVERVQSTHAPMVVAAEAGNTAAIQLMVSLGFDVNALGRIAALHEAASTGNIEIVRLLLTLGADPNLHDRAFDAPALGWARHNGHDEAAAILEPLTG
ncbi:MAG: ankyrin repeat domain-containing protein [Acidimicrobiia bacterium]|nr:ankyrin repeat domain-containing protein [Acidimicrobiia bacterium]